MVIMNCNEILSKDWDWGYKKVYVKPNIPMKKLNGALGSYAKSVAPEDVLVLIDDTVFGGAKEGLVLTGEAMYCKELASTPRIVRFSDNPEVMRGKNSTIMVNGSSFFKATAVAHTAILTFSSRVMSCLAETSEVRLNDRENEASDTNNIKDNNVQVPEQHTTKDADKPFLNFLTSDTLFDGFSKMSKINLVGSVADILKSGPSANVDIVEKQFFKYIYENMKSFREIAESRNLHALNNDIASLELLSFLMGKFIADMLANKIKPDYIDFLSNRCLASIFPHNNKSYSTIIEGALAYCQSEKPFMLLLVRLGCSNLEKQFKAEYNYRDYAYSIFPNEQGFGEFLEKIETQLGNQPLSIFAQSVESQSTIMIKKVLSHPVNVGNT